MKEMYGDLVQQLVVAATRLSEEVRGGQGGEGGREGKGEGEGGRGKGREGGRVGEREGKSRKTHTHTPTDRWGCWKRMCWWVRPGEREATALRKVRQT